MSTDLEELAVAARARVGTSLRGKYILQRLIGVGATAAVYESTHRNGTRAAVKILHGAAATIPEIRQRFLREGYIANRIQHAGVVRVADDDDDNGTAFLVMELLEGHTVEAEVLAGRGRLEVTRVLEIADGLLDVLDAAHAAGVIHRDIKPDNLFVARTGLKVLDFGIARLMDSVGSTKSGQLMGTPDFIAPEQAGGVPQAVDSRVDIYTTGAMMFKLLTGEPVHKGRTPFEQVMYAATRQARRLADTMPGLDPNVANVVDTALAFDREKRWRTARDMQRAVRSAAGALEPTISSVNVQMPPALVEERRRMREERAVSSVPQPAVSSTQTLPLTSPPEGVPVPVKRS